MAEQVNHPAHYNQCDPTYEPINIIEAHGLSFSLGNCVKYILRAHYKNGLEDLKKARWYLDREIARQESKKTDAC